MGADRPLALSLQRLPPPPPAPPAPPEGEEAEAAALEAALALAAAAGAGGEASGACSFGAAFGETEACSRTEVLELVLPLGGAALRRSAQCARAADGLLQVRDSPSCDTLTAGLLQVRDSPSCDTLTAGLLQVCAPLPFRSTHSLSAATH
jgi:hypothetical protein